MPWVEDKHPPQKGWVPDEQMTAQVAKARAAGYTDAEIAAHLAGKPGLGPKIQAARSHGYDDSEIVGHLAKPAPPIRAEMHDGTILEFPAGTDPRVIQATVRKQLREQASAQPAPKVFKVQAPDGRIIKVEAADEATAIRGAQEHYASLPENRPKQGGKNVFDRFDAPPPKKTGGNYFDRFDEPQARGPWDRYAAPAKPRDSLLTKATGAMANFNRGLGIGDEIAGGIQGVANAYAAVKKGDYGAVPNALQDGMRKQRAIEDRFQETNPHSAALARGVGNVGGMAAPFGPTANVLATGTRAANMARGAVSAGTTAVVAAAADRGTARERLGAASDVARNPVVLGLGAAGGAMIPAARRATGPTDKSVLADVGVSTSIPQQMGRAAKGVEDLLKRFPITGQAMAGYQDRQLGQLNRAIGLKALQPIGQKIPASIKPGFEMVQYVDDKLGEVYERAAKLVPRVKLDRELQNEFSEISRRTVDLPESEAAQFERIIADRTQRLSDGVSGSMVKKIHSELGGLQAEAAKAGKDTLAAMIGDTRRAIMGTVARASPEAGRLIRRADQGWSVYSIMNDAAAAASARGGIFLPGQLNTQVRSAARRVGSNMAGKGKGPLQDIATAASRTIPDSYGNPGTANAVSLGSGGVGLFTAPGETLVAGAGLAAVATPYLAMGRKLMESLPEGATQRQLSIAARQLEAMARRDPKVIPLYREVSARLSKGAGVVGGTSSPSIEVQVEGRPERGYAYGR